MIEDDDLWAPYDNMPRDRGFAVVIVAATALWAVILGAIWWAS